MEEKVPVVTFTDCSNVANLVSVRVKVMASPSSAAASVMLTTGSLGLVNFRYAFGPSWSLLAPSVVRYQVAK